MRRRNGGAGVAPAPLWLRTQESGSPWVPVRSYYEGLPSMAGRGPDEGLAKAARITGDESPPVGLDERGPGVEDATVERREAACPQGTWAPSTRCQTKT